jgi:hypothetical protein
MKKKKKKIFETMSAAASLSQSFLIFVFLLESVPFGLEITQMLLCFVLIKLVE